MQFFSLNACLLGLIYALFLIFFNWVYVLFAVWRKIKIEEIIFLYGSKALLRADVNGVKYHLNWIPFGTSVKLLGLGASDQEEIDKIPKEDLPFAFFNQPVWVRILFRMIPTLLYLGMAMSVFAFGVDFSSFRLLLSDIWIFYFSLTGFDQFAIAVSNFSTQHSTILFALVFMNLIAAFQMSLNEIFSQATIYGRKKKVPLTSILGTLLFLSSGWMLYKVMGFAGSYFGYLPLAILYVNMLAVIFVVIVVLFFAMLPLFRKVLPDQNDSQKSTVG